MNSLEELKEKYPKIYQAVFDKGHAEGLLAVKQKTNDNAYEEGRTEGIALGARQERDRIKAVEDQLIPGHENLVTALKFDGQTTGEQAAVKVLQAEKEIRATAKTDFQNDAPEPLPPTAEPGQPVAKTPQEKWDSDPDLQNEFDSFDTWQAYENAISHGWVKMASDGRGK